MKGFISGKDRSEFAFCTQFGFETILVYGPYNYTRKQITIF